MRNCICLWVTNEDLSKTFLSSDRSFLFHDTFNLKALPPKEAWLFALSLYEFGRIWLAKVALLIFLCLPIHLVGCLDPLGVLLLLENSVARNEGGDEHWERGGTGHGTPPCA